MAKCGKGCMPECQFFTTGGCVSPFNCPYKVENESITTATSTPCNLYPLETDKDKEISRLQAENSELRARLDKAVELPLVQTIRGNKLPYEVAYKDGNGRIIVTKYRRWQKKQAEARLKELQGGDMKYTEILKLKEMLEEANIPFTFTNDSFGVKKKLEENPSLSLIYREKYPAYQIRLGHLADAIENCFSYGNEQDLLEIMGGLTEEEEEYGGVLGWLTAEEVFKRFKYCWEHQTSVYKEVEE